MRWAVVLGHGGAATIAQTQDAEAAQLATRALQDPLVQAVFAAFPNAVIREFIPPVSALDPAEAVIDDAGEDWDPFED